MRSRAEAGRDKAPLFIPYDPASKSVRGRLKSQVSAHVARRAWRNGRPGTQVSTKSESCEEQIVELPTHMVRRDGSQVILQPILKKIPTDTPDSLVKYLYDEYMPNFLPGTDPKSWIEAAKSSPAMYYGLLFKAQAQYRMQQNDPVGGREMHDVVLYRKGVTEVNKAMSNVTDQNLDALVCAVAFLAFNVDEAPALSHRTPRQSGLQDLQWLRMVSSYESKPEHLQGLLQLLRQRGSLHNIKIAGAAQALSYGDIRDATRYLRHPGLPFIALGLAEKMQMSSPAQLSSSSQSPLCSSALKAFFSPNKGYPFTNFVDAIDMIVEYVHLVNSLMPGGIDHRDTQLIDSRNLTQYILMSVPFLDDLVDLSVGRKYTRLELEIYELCRLATMIFSLLMVFPLPPRSAPFHQIAKQIQTRISPVDWFRIPVVISTWVLYMGAVASIGHDIEHNFFISTLKTTKEGNSLSWDETRAMLMSCLWDCTVSDPDGIEIWVKTQTKPG